MHSFWTKFIALLVMAGLVFASHAKVAEVCCDHDPAAASESGEPEHSDDHDCECICHQALVTDRPQSQRAICRTLDDGFPFSEQAHALPDAVPLGIEHPPQIV